MRWRGFVGMEKLQCVSELFPTRNSVKEWAGNKGKAGRVPLRVRLGSVLRLLSRTEKVVSF